MADEPWVWVIAAAVGWWLLRGDVSGWRRGLRDPDLTGVMILQLAVGVLLWVWLAADIDAPSAVEVPITILAFCAALTAGVIALFGLRLLIVTVAQRLLDRRTGERHGRRDPALLQHEPLRRSDPRKADLSDRCCRTPVDRARSSDSRRCTRAASQSAARLASGLADRLR